jgi:hypothetical protein
MDVWLTKKNVLIENLFSSTTELLNVCRAANWDALDKCIADRAHLLDQIVACDKKVETTPTVLQEKWKSLLSTVKKHDEEICKILEKNSQQVGRQLIQLHDRKIETIRELDLDPRGNQLKAQG